MAGGAEDSTSTTNRRGKLRGSRGKTPRAHCGSQGELGIDRDALKRTNGLVAVDGDGSSARAQAVTSRFVVPHGKGEITPELVPKGKVLDGEYRMTDSLGKSSLCRTSGDEVVDGRDLQWRCSSSSSLDPCLGRHHRLQRRLKITGVGLGSLVRGLVMVALAKRAGRRLGFGGL